MPIFASHRTTTTMMCFLVSRKLFNQQPQKDGSHVPQYSSPLVLLHLHTPGRKLGCFFKRGTRRDLKQYTHEWSPRGCQKMQAMIVERRIIMIQTVEMLSVENSDLDHRIYSRLFDRCDSIRDVTIAIDEWYALILGWTYCTGMPISLL